MKIMGWTDWDNPKYTELKTKTWKEYNEIEKLVADELRSKGYKFDGEYHQNGDYGAPVFEDGTILKCTKRAWGGIMALAYPEGNLNDGYDYCRWAWMIPKDEDYSLPIGSDCINIEVEHGKEE